MFLFHFHQRHGLDISLFLGGWLAPGDALVERASRNLFCGRSAVGRLHWSALRLLSKSPLPDSWMGRWMESGYALAAYSQPAPIKPASVFSATAGPRLGCVPPARHNAASWALQGSRPQHGVWGLTMRRVVKEQLPLRASSRTQSDRLSPGSKTNIEAYVVKDDDICQRRSRTVVKIKCAACKSTENGALHFSDIGPFLTRSPRFPQRPQYIVLTVCKPHHMLSFVAGALTSAQ